MNKALALTDAIIHKDWELATSLANEYRRHPSLKPLLKD
jgi:hypothetical protein